MTATDILLLAGILAFVALGIRDGFMKKLFGILGFVGGLVLATKFMGDFSLYLKEWLGLPNDASCIFAFFVIFIGVVIVVNLCYRWFGQSGNDTLKFWSRMAGGLVGAAQGIVAMSLILVMANVFDIPSEEEKSASVLYSEIFPIAPQVFDYATNWMPSSKGFFDEVKGTFEKYKSVK